MKGILWTLFWAGLVSVFVWPPLAGLLWIIAVVVAIISMATREQPQAYRQQESSYDDLPRAGSKRGGGSNLDRLEKKGYEWEKK